MADFVSMKLSDAQIKAQTEGMPEGYTPEEYPYGLRLELDKDQMDKLGIKELPAIDSEMTIVAKVRVCDLHAHASKNSEHQSIGLQVTDMAIQSKAGMDYKKALYGNG